MSERETEQDPYLQRCPHCAAWPMSFVEMETGWRAREARLRFTCPRCHTTAAFIAMRVIHRQPAVESAP
jgi:hypothetical protein